MFDATYTESMGLHFLWSQDYVKHFCAVLHISSLFLCEALADLVKQIVIEIKGKFGVCVFFVVVILYVSFVLLFIQLESYSQFSGTMLALI